MSEQTKHVTFHLQYCGISDKTDFDVTGMTQEEIEKELVQWVLECVDHWVEESESSE